jgi:hypothetical protein
MGKWLQSNEHLTFEVRERVARITLNRPDRRNALSWEMLSELRAALLEADDLRSVSVIVLGGAGPDFCAGYDMKSAYARYAAEGDAALDYRSFDDDVWSDAPWDRRVDLQRRSAVGQAPAVQRRDLAKRTTRFSGRLNARPQRPRGCWPRCRPARSTRNSRSCIDDESGVGLPAFHLPHLSAPSKAPISRRINASSALVCAASSALAVVNVAVDEFFSLSFNLWLNQ